MESRWIGLVGFGELNHMKTRAKVGGVGESAELGD